MKDDVIDGTARVVSQTPQSDDGGQRPVYVQPAPRHPMFGALGLAVLGAVAAYVVPAAIEYARDAIHGDSDEVDFEVED